MNQANNHPLATEPIGKLIARFSIPCVISLLVNSLYNIVDQIFIGHGVGYLGNGATNVVFPITVIALAFALLLGDGGAAFLSLKLGQGETENAQKGVGNAITLLTVVGVAFLAAGLVFLKPLCTLFGATDIILPYALEYGGVIVLGLAFVIIGTGLNSIIRADGSPKFAMFSMLLGAVLNTVLDPIFIFVLRMGVRGAAIATVIGQVASFVLSAVYLTRFKSIRLGGKSLRPDAGLARSVMGLGISSFITQIAITIVMAVTNNMLAIYGAQSVYGAEIPLTALGIVMKVNQIMISVLIGIAAGAQPIVGYNYGAGNYRRVRKTFHISVVAASCVSVLAFVAFAFFPDVIINLFGSEDGLYMEFSRKCFRIFLCLCAFTGFQVVAGIFLQAIGKPVKAAAASLSRQIVFLVPAAVIIPRFVGVEGVLWAGPVADGLALVLTVLLMASEMRRINGEIAAREAAEQGTRNLVANPAET